MDVIETAEALLNVGKAEFAAGRVYYAMFPCTARHIVPETERVGGQVYVAEALLYNEFDLKFSQHGQVIAAYGKNFAKTQALDPKFNRWLRDGFDKQTTDD